MSLVLLGLIAAQAAAVAAQPPLEAQADPVICRSEQSEVGTHMRPKRVCMKKSEWALVQANTETQVDRVRDRGSFNPGMASGHGPQ